MTAEDVIGFLREVLPFQDLDEATLRAVAGTISIEFYPKGSIILQQDGPASEYLRIIRKGGVKVFIRSGKDEEVMIDSRGEGDSFGFLSLVSGDKSRANVVATDDTTCYLISRETVLKLLETYPAFSEYFLVSFLNKYIDKSYREVRKKSVLYGGGERLLFTTPVGELSTKDVITASQAISIREAAEIMSHNRISSLILLDPDGVPAGIVTDRDLRDKVLAKGRSGADPIKSIMSVSLVKADAREYCFEALLRMTRYNIHHLLVIDNGKLMGVISNHDLMMLQGTSPISIVREIESQQSIEGLVPLSKKIDKIVGLLIKEGAKASNITRIITEMHDRLMKKVIEITEKRIGTPPLDYCWIVLGGAGRKEQTFKTDQDNALIYEDPPTDAKDEEARKYFSDFTLFVKDGLLKCGFPLCPANYMASNPQWRRPLKVWKKHFSGWISDPTPNAVLKSLIFFDFRPIYGDLGLAEELRDFLTSAAQGQRLYLGYTANTIIKNTPPMGFFKSFVVEKSGEHKDEFDLKLRGIAPFVDAVRLFALENGIKETSTIERLQALRDRHTLIEEHADELEHAFEFLMLLGIQHQLEQIESGNDLDNFINPNKLNNLERRIIKDVFHLISKMQDLVIERYKSMIM